MNNAIPGFLALPPSNQDNIIYAAADGSVNGVVHYSTEPCGFQVVIETREGLQLFFDPQGESIFRTGDEYRFIQTAAQLDLPLGTTYLRLLVNRQPKTFYIVVTDECFRTRQLHTLCGTGVSQSGQITLAQGVQSLVAPFPIDFLQTPTVLVPVIFVDAAAEDPLVITASVSLLTAHEFGVQLSVAPNTSGYRLGWAAWI
jgi:hypothetical protein